MESAIGAHLINHSLTSAFSVFYWRQGKDEVDFVLEKKGEIIGIEVKSSAASQTKGMESFQQAFKPKKVLLVGGNGLSFDEFLSINPKELF